MAVKPSIKSIYAKAYKRVKGKFVQIGNVVGQKISSFIEKFKGVGGEI